MKYGVLLSEKIELAKRTSDPVVAMKLSGTVGQVCRVLNLITYYMGGQTTVKDYLKRGVN